MILGPDAASQGDPVKELASLLREANAVPRLSPERMVRSSFYDAVYRACITGLAIRECGRRVLSAWSLNDQLLRLYQFTAIHRGLLKPLQEWAAARRSGTLTPLQEWARFPAGYATDTIHDGVVTYLLATGQLRRDRTTLVLDELPTSTFLWSLLRAVDAATLFPSERLALVELRQSGITLGMLRS